MLCYALLRYAMLCYVQAAAFASAEVASGRWAAGSCVRECVRERQACANRDTAVCTRFATTAPSLSASGAMLRWCGRVCASVGPMGRRHGPLRDKQQSWFLAIA